METDIDMPILLRNILQFNGYDSKALLSSFGDEDSISKIEAFMRSSADLLEEHKMPVYFGIFKLKPQKFQLLEGNISFNI